MAKFSKSITERGKKKKSKAVVDYFPYLIEMALVQKNAINAERVV